MLFTFVIMLAIELSLFWDKPKARYFATTVLVIGLVMRGLALEATQRRKRAAAAASTLTPTTSQTEIIVPTPAPTVQVSGAPLLCAVRGVGRTLDFALEQAREMRRPLYLLFLRVLPALTEADQKRKWQEDEEASRIFNEAKQKAGDHPPLFAYAVSPSASETIVDIAATLGASRLILGAPQRNALINLLRGNVIREVSSSLPEEIDLLVYA